VRSEERDRGIPPVVDQARRTVLPIELEYRKQLHSGDSEILEVWDFLDHARIGPPPLRGDPRAWMLRETRNMHLVDHGLGEGPAQRCVALPIVDIGIDHHALYGVRVGFAVSARGVARVSIGHDDGASIGIKEDLGGIETQTALGIERTVGAIRINLSWTDSGHKDVPVMVGAMRVSIEADYPRRFRRGSVIEQQQLHSARLSREHAEVDAVGEDGGAQGKASPRARSRCRRSKSVGRSSLKSREASSAILIKWQFMK